MRKHLVVATGVVFALAATAPVFAQTAAAPSPAGKWDMGVETQQGTTMSVVDLALEGKRLSGTAATTTPPAQMPLKGEFADGKVVFSLMYDAGNGAVELIFRGAFKDANTLTGTMDYGQTGTSMNWSATRRAAPAADTKAGPAASGLNIAGNWSMALDIPAMGSQATPTLVFKQDGEKVTGTYTGRYGAYDFKGTLKGKALEFSFQMNTDGGTTTMSFSGEVTADARSMKGSGAIEGLGDVTWTAAKGKG